MLSRRLQSYPKGINISNLEISAQITMSNYDLLCVLITGPNLERKPKFTVAE